MEINRPEYRFVSQPAVGREAGPSRTFTGVAYSGGVVKDHTWFDAVVFDLSTTRAPDRMPVLLEHRRSDIVGYTDRVEIGDDIRVSGKVFAREAGQKVADMADEGFPWQMSVTIYPDTISEYSEGESVTVNGVKHKGPITVLRDSLVREVSFCVLGADRETTANIFNLQERDMPNGETNPLESKVNRDLALQALTDEKNQFRAKADEAKSQNAKLLAEYADLKSQFQSLQYEHKSLTDSLGVARKEAEEYRHKYEALNRDSRKAVLESDYRRLGREFKADDESVMAILAADLPAFEAFRKVLADVRPAMAPPAGAFEPITQPTDFSAGAPKRSLADLAASWGKKEVKNG
jgi:hypothetical protein